jgi:hypothetical protein
VTKLENNEGSRAAATSERNWLRTQSGNLDEIGGKLCLPTFGLFWKEGIQQLSLYFGQRNQRRRHRRHAVDHGPQWSPQNRPFVVTSKPANGSTQDKLLFNLPRIIRQEISVDLHMLLVLQ